MIPLVDFDEVEVNDQMLCFVVCGCVSLHSKKHHGFICAKVAHHQCKEISKDEWTEHLQVIKEYVKAKYNIERGAACCGVADTHVFVADTHVFGGARKKPKGTGSGWSSFFTKIAKKWQAELKSGLSEVVNTVDFYWRTLLSSCGILE
jgi:hypothetical protein